MYVATQQKKDLYVNNFNKIQERLNSYIYIKQ